MRRVSDCGLIFILRIAFSVKLLFVYITSFFYRDLGSVLRLLMGGRTRDWHKIEAD